MFSCLWQLWDWLEPTSMENAKGVYQNNSPSNNEIVIEATTQKHLHQHATGPPPPHLRLLQYGLKPSNNNPTPNSPLYLHIHPQQLQYQSIATHRHLQTSPQQFNNKYVLHQNQMYTPVYHPAPPPPLHPYTAQPIQQNTPQIWVPHQPPPIHYHHQQQNKFHSPETPKTVAAPPTQPKTTPPTKEPVERKKSSQSCQLRSPAAKRPPEAPVTMQGWLHKQGSEGLMLWKKRWFVLSEYCLFYYKGLEEEKLLGSILLPSYKVSVCGPESKVNRKFAFKCEHANMRTYLLAADSQELMQQWIRVLNLACLLQSNVETTPYLSNSQINEESPDNNNQTKNGQVPLHMHSSSNTTELSNQSQQELSQFNQPLYANAPPKPRRLNDGGYSSPSPDVLERYMTPQYGRSPYNFPLSLPQPQEYIQHPHNRLVHPHPHEYNFPNSNTQNVERRTPDTYGRSKLTPDKHHIDYEDVYIDQSVYKRPLSPIAYNHITKKNNPPVVVNPAYRTYTPVNMLGPNHPITMRKSPSQISRPHSADFLEYEFNHRSPSNQTKQQPRPKSSLDINRNPDSDNYFYSEERYAEKMRKSALYLQNTQQPQIIKPPHLHLPQPTRCRSVLSEGSLSRELDSPCERDVVSPGYHPQNANYYARTTPGQFDQFARSASARLAEDVQGDRKREESMKRLLEWKQRMLQSPLNRKAQGNRRQEYYMLQPPENMYGMPKYHLDSSSDGRRSVNHLPQYNSYSSDDEENVEMRSKDSMQSQAGRTLDTLPTSNTESVTSAHSTSTTVFNTGKETDKPLTRPNDPCMLSPCSNSVLNSLQTDTLTKPLKQFNKELSTIAHVSSLRSEFSKKFEQTPLITEIKSHGALVKSILAEFEKPSDKSPIATPTLDENYMSMTAKKNILDPAESAVEPEENPYVEMSQNTPILANTPQIEQQPYELVCFSEPVYMELKQPKDKKELPDILSKTESDSSDADDEASKDLDTPNQQRFSLSDSFRPASYYLGASQTVPEFPDSSDSELVSPPPIPASPSPLEDIPGQRSSSASLGSATSEIELRVPFRDDLIEYERRLKRRPVSEEFCDELASLDQTMDSADLDHYLRDLETSGFTNSSFGHFHEYENMFVNGVYSPQNEDFARPSNCSTPNMRLSASMSIQDVATVLEPIAPYYYSDLSVNTSHNDSVTTVNLLTLNNQRTTLANGNKKDISHIVNPIKDLTDPQDNSTFKLAAEARSVSVDFLNLTDKSGHIDKKNIYQSDTLKRQKVNESNNETRNFYLNGKDDKFDLTGESNVRRTQSLEGLLENVLTEGSQELVVPPEPVNSDVAVEGSYLWEEDAIWRERLRSASQRHTKSMDNLDSIGLTLEVKKNTKKSPRGITRGVTYVNDNLYPNKANETPPKNELKKENSFLIDREKLRQWDLLSSAPSDDQLSTLSTINTNSGKAGQEPSGTNTVVELLAETTDICNAQQSASGSISLNARETFPRALSGKKVWQPTNNPKMLQSRSITNVNKNGDHESNYGHPGFFIGQSPSQQDMNPDPSYIRKDNVNDKMNVSAGELLGRTHEELVLLLIQLRRQSSHNLQSIENAYNEIDTIQAQLHMMDHARRLENLQKLDQIKQHLLELEKQYEKSKPLVNLVDNMVKLGSLYRVPSDKNSSIIRDRSEFNQQVQERRLLAEEKRDWNRLNPNHIQLQEKVQQLYQLDKLIQEESGTLYNLQQDKEDIERALGGLRMRLTKGFSDPAEVEHARKQQMILESELSRVHMMLAKNAKKLEETVAGNARLEQELLVLKQKLQTSRQQRSSPQFSNPGDSLPCVVGTSVMLESDLQKVQKKIGDLQKQRQELSMQVRQLTDRSNNLAQLKPLPLNSAALQNVQCNKRRVPSLWRETDLDTMDSIDHGDSWDNQLPPLYINTELKQSTEVEDPSSSNPIEKQQEIKTVRIVKRESERRQRDREKTMAPLTGKWDPLLEEDDSSQNSSILFRPTPAKTPQIIPNQSNYPESSSTEKSPELSPIFKSEAARQIITEMSTPQEAPPQNKQPNRRVVPKEKRRHYTAPHNNLIMKSLHQLPTDDNAFDKMILNTRRARDDLDMERALRQRIDAPDVVRSTLSNKELKYNESTIDNLLGTPNKISIPERYIPEQLPQLTVEEQEHRLRKVESIKKMLSDTTIISGSSKTQEDSKNDEPINSIVNKSTTKMIEEKKQREHLLQLNQILAKQVMEMSKIVAVKALSKLPLEAHQNGTTEEEDLSPMTPLPLYQQRDNFYS